MDSDEEREDEMKTWRGVSGTVILINVFERRSASVAYAASCRMVRQYLRSSGSNTIGVCLYGAEDSSANTSAFGIKSVIDVFPLTTPTLDDFKKLRSIDLTAYKPVRDFELSDVLWHCSKMFTNCKKLLSSKSVLMLTRLDTAPVAADQKPTLKRVVDLVDANIDIKIISISEEAYRVDPFYETFLSEANKGSFEGLPQPVWDEREIERLMHQQSHRHLSVANLSFEIGNGVFIGVGVYNLLRKSAQYQPKKYDLDRESNTILSSSTKTVKVSVEANNDIAPMDVDGEDNQPKQMPLLKSEILFYQEYGGERVEFNDNEMKKLKNPFGPPMIKLLGFKPASLICKEKWFLKSGYFLFPNEGLIEGSMVAFKAMHQACAETGMVGICVLCTRVNAKPIIVAVNPCTHPLGLDVEVGFDVIQIPFVENVRDIPAVEDDGDIITSEEQKILLKDLLQTLKFDYKPEMFEDPKSQSVNRAIEAIALEDEEVDAFVDTTIPEAEKFASIQEELFEELFGPFEQVAPKRPTTAKESGPRNKIAKGCELDESLVQDRITYQTVHQFTVPQLKEILKNNGSRDIPALTGLKKDRLVELVYKHCTET